MIPRSIEFAPEAQADLERLQDWISERAGDAVASDYIERIEKYCLGFDIASERGHSRDDIRPGLRIVGFEHRLTLAFVVEDRTVTFLRVFYGGRNWEDILR